MLGYILFSIGVVGSVHGAHLSLGRMLPVLKQTLSLDGAREPTTVFQIWAFDRDFLQLSQVNLSLQENQLTILVASDKIQAFK